MWNDMQDEYYACGKAEREAAEKKRIEDEKKFTQEAPEPAPFTVSNLEGAIWFTHPNELTEYIVTPTTPITPGSGIRTDTGAHGEIRFTENSAVQIGPETLILYMNDKLLTYILDDEETGFDLVRGMIRITNDPTLGGTVIMTPVGTVKDKHTDFIVEVDEKNKTSVYLYEGALDINTTQGEYYTLKTGQMITIEPIGEVKMSELNAAEWDAMTNSIATGEKYVHSTPLEEQTDTQAQQDTQADAAGQLAPKEQKKVMIMIAVMAVILIALIAVIVKRRKK
jgi:hypothetical protein